MNNTLNINRLGKVIKRDGAGFAQNLGIALIILWAIPVIIWLFGNMTPFNGKMDPFSRLGIIGTLRNILIIIAPARLYKYCNNSRQGMGYAMMPASSLEKFISMVFYCIIVAPIVYIVGALAVDSVLALIGGSYEGFAVPAYFDKYAQLKHALDNKMFLSEEDYSLVSDSISLSFFITLKIASVIMLSSIFMFGNMVFKKHKTGKMIGILILLSIISMIAFINYVSNHETIFQLMDEDNAADVIKRMLYIITRAAIVISAIISVVMLWGTYHKIKTQKY